MEGVDLRNFCSRVLGTPSEEKGIFEGLPPVQLLSRYKRGTGYLPSIDN